MTTVHWSCILICVIGGQATSRHHLCTLWRSTK